jgi:outer membrane protein
MQWRTVVWRTVFASSALLGLLPWLTQPAAANPLTLAEAIEAALGRNPAVHSAVETARAAQARVGTARSIWLPQLSATTILRGDYSYQPGDTDPDKSGGAGTGRYTGQLQLNQMIYDFGRTSGRIEAARAVARAFAADADTARARAALDTVSGFYTAIQAAALLDVARRNVEQQRQRQQQAESFFRIGTKPEIDVLIARTAVASAELQVVQQQNSLWVARAQLIQTVGLDASEWPAWLSRPLEPPPPIPLSVENDALLDAPERAAEGLLDEALSRRPEYRAQRERVAQAAAQLKQVRGDYLPILSLSGNLSVAGSFGGNSSLGSISTVGSVSTVLPSGSYPTLGLSGLLTLTWPIFNGLQTIYAVRDSAAQLGAAEANLDALRMSMRTQLLIALYQLSTARRSQFAASALAEQADKQLQMARGRYKAGVGNAIELGDAEVGAMTAAGQRVQTDSQLGLARSTLRWHLGSLLPVDR